MPQIQNNGGVLELQTGFGPYSSYQWYLNGSIVAGANQASLLPSFSGTYYVEVSNAFGCSVNSFPLTVAVNPNLTIAFFSPQDDTLCVGQSTLMNNNSQNANSYLWTCPGAIPPSSNLAQPSFSFPSPGNYQVQLIASGTTGTDTVYANVYVPVLPFVFGGNDQAICPGGFVQMNGITALNNVVQWSPAAGLSNPNLIAPIANPTQTTTYVVSVFDGYCINHDTVIVVVFPTPALPLIQFNNGQLTLQSGSGPYSGYQWILNGSALGGAVFQDLFPPQSGIYSLQVSDTNGCISTSDTIQVAVTGVHLGESYQDVIVYPNPAEGELTIQVSEPREIESIELQGLDGRLIKRINGLVFTEQTTLTREDCSAGMYALIIRTKNSEPKIIKVIYR
jgi:PKD repeat protein